MSVFALLERLAPHMEKEVNLVINSKQEAEGLSSKLKKIQKGLQGAERKGVMDDSVKDWLKQLEDVTYEMDDVLDEWQTANLQVQLEGSEDLSDPWEKVRSLVLSLCLCFKHVMGRREITKKMKALRDRIDNILKERDQYNFALNPENDRSQEFKQGETISLPDKVYGRDFVKDSLVEKLKAEGQENNAGTEIISIVGIGEVGKTTLAQFAYNDPEVDDYFSLKAWVCVSEPSDASAIAKAVLEAFGGSSANAHNLETLVIGIRKAVEKKRFLLVLDNVWTKDGNRWENLKKCLHGAKGSKILVTTRSESVARMMGTTQWQWLHLLSDSDCGTILNEIALEGKKREEREKLRPIGIEIAKKCNGLPLAAKSLGRMLALKPTDEQVWRDVLENPLWEYKNEVSDTFHLLNLSYIDLSPVLKRCFLSCVIFPKGALMNIDKIIRIWMAYGYLSLKASPDKVQSYGLDYFNDLAMRSFFQKLESDEHDGDTTSYKMHDIMHDFANYLSGSEYKFIMDGRVETEKSLPPWNHLERLRTFCARFVPEELLLKVLSRLRSVRVLSMCHCDFKGLPREVGKLIHLRYLDLSSNPVRELPETVCDLHNLQTLGLENCENISSLPQGIEKLISLRHLLNSGAENLVDYPQGLEKLTGLWTISEFRGSKLGCLRNLNQLQGSLFLCIRGLNATADSLEEVRKANLRNKIHIKKLKLEFGEEEERVDIVDALQPPPNLHTLVIRSSRGKWLSHWIDASSFNNIKTLEFNGYGLSSTLPPFGKLPALEKLVISCSFKCLSMEFLGLEGVIVDANGVSKTQSAAILLSSSSSKRTGCFPRLKKLRFEECVWWEEWEDIKEEAQDYSVPIMTCLEELEIERCPHLKALPHALLRQATSLKILRLTSERLYDRYNKVSGYDRHNIPHIQIVRFLPRAELIWKIRQHARVVRAAIMFQEAARSMG